MRTVSSPLVVVVLCFGSVTSTLAEQVCELAVPTTSSSLAPFSDERWALAREVLEASDAIPTTFSQAAFSMLVGEVNERVPIDVFEARSHPLPYRLLRPTDYDPGRLYALVVHLHGSNGVGSNNQKQMIWVARAWALPERQKLYPAFVLAPQAPGRWEASMDAVVEIIAFLKDEFSIDEDRIYVDGYSGGGVGTWRLLETHADLFAAAVPIAAGQLASQDAASLIAQIPVWVFNGERDTNGTQRPSRELVQSIWDAGGSTHFTEYTAAEHAGATGVIFLAYTEPALNEWMFAQRRNTLAPAPSANFVSPENAIVGEEVLFDAASSTTPDGTEISSYEWNLADGSLEEDVEVHHVYSEPGLHNVTLTVTNDQGFCHQKTVMVAVQCPEEDVQPWVSLDVGQPGFPGSARFEGEDGGLVVCAAGTNTDAAFHFVHQDLLGNVVLTTRAKDLLAEKHLSEVGVMLREGLEPEAPHATLYVQSLVQERGGLGEDVRRLRFAFAYRGTEDNQRTSTFGNAAEVSDPWLQIRREGNDFVGRTSVDGTNWTEVGRQTLELPARLHGGVAVSGGDPVLLDDFRPLVVRFSSLEVSGISSTGFLRGDCDGDGNGELELADAVYGLNFCFAGTNAPVAPFPACGPGTETNAALGCETSSCQ